MYFCITGKPSAVSLHAGENQASIVLSLLQRPKAFVEKRLVYGSQQTIITLEPVTGSVRVQIKSKKKQMTHACCAPQRR